MPGSDTMSVKASKEEQAALLAAAPEVYSAAAYVGRFGWVRVELSRVDAAELGAGRRGVAANRAEEAGQAVRRAGLTAVGQAGPSKPFASATRPSHEAAGSTSSSVIEAVIIG
ncbi:hypothetical protein ACFQZ4_15300 [Catellatospora coxensis]